jgi:hypothetical protein
LTDDTRGEISSRVDAVAHRLCLDNRTHGEPDSSLTAPLLEIPARQWQAAVQPALATGKAGTDLLYALARLLRLL